MAAESQVNELQARLNDAVNQRRHFEDEYNVSNVVIFLPKYFYFQIELQKGNFLSMTSSND